jgi:hypothetical protein
MSVKHTLLSNNFINLTAEFDDGYIRAKIDEFGVYLQEHPNVYLDDVVIDFEDDLTMIIKPVYKDYEGLNL